MRIDISKYLGIPYKHLGSDWTGSDCYGLVRLFYKNELGISIPDYEYDENWCEKGFDFIRKYFKEHWIRIDKPNRYDIVGFRMPGFKVEHHLGIVLYDFDQFLHSPLNMPVCVSRLSERIWKRSIENYYRILDVD